jgi:cytochrome P450
LEPTAPLPFEAEIERFPSENLMQCPFPFYKQGRDAAAVQKVPGKEVYLVFRYADVAQVFRDTQTYSVVFEHSQSTKLLEYGGAAHLLGTDPPEHKRKRELAGVPFTPLRLKNEEPAIRSIVDDLIDTFAKRGTAEFVAEFAFPLPARVICRMMGLPSSGSRYEAICRWSTELVRVASADELSAHQLDADAKTTNDVVEFVAETVRSRAVSPGNDLISEFIQRQSTRDGRPDLDLATTIALEMLAGGVITTGQMLANGMSLLVRHPDQMAELRRDPSQISAMIEEALRIEAPVQHRPRKAARDTELGGVRIPAGAYLFLMVGSGNRDEAQFECPGEFRIARSKSPAHLSFGAGIHFCMGAPLARLEGRIAFERLLARLEPIELSDRTAPVANVKTRLFRAPAVLNLTFGGE